MLALVAYSLKPVKLLAWQFLTILLFCDWRSVAQQCYARLHRTTTMLASWHVCKRELQSFFRITKPECIASLDNRQQCWQLLRLFACTTQQVPTTPNIVGLTMLWLVASVCMGFKGPCKRTQHCWPTTRNSVGQQHATLLGPTCCDRLHGTTTMLALVAYSLKPVKLLGPCKQTQRCWSKTPQQHATMLWLVASVSMGLNSWRHGVFSKNLI